MNNATDIAAHIVDPCRPAKTMCGKPSDGASPDWQTAATTCKRCARGAATLRRMGPDLVSYWAGSVGSSVVNAFDRGDCVTVYVGDGAAATHHTGKIGHRADGLEVAEHDVIGSDGRPTGARVWVAADGRTFPE